MKSKFVRWLAGLLAAIWCGVAAPSHALTYDVNFSDGTNSATGTITTNGHTGVLLPSDITGWNLALHAGGATGISIGTAPSFFGSPLLASTSVLDFEPTGGDVAFVNGDFWQLLGTSHGGPFGATVYSINNVITTVPFSAPFNDLPIGVAEITPPDNTPLPAALPLFASGLGALGLLGWRRKRKQTAEVNLH
jgi:hypothetical protein